MFEQSDQFIRICSNILGQNYNTKRLAGGINNPTYLLSNKNSHFVLKKITTDPTPIFDRYLAEKQFLHLANTIDDINTPKLIEWYDTERILISEYLRPDENIDVIKIDEQRIKDCIKFIHKINSKTELSKEIVQQRAADCYLGLTGHIENINSRILNFDVHHLPDEYKNNAAELLFLLNKKWQILKEDTLRFIDINPDKNNIDKSFLIISPSDFGFHNVITSRRTNYFIDFEFSGWDDPAKLYCDFILQPKIPIPRCFHALLKIELMNKNYIIEYKNRIDILYKLLEFKWHTIKYSFLNEHKYQLNQFNKLNLLKINSKAYLNEIH